MATSINPFEVSEFYLACRNGDVEFVKSHLKTLSPTIWNPNQFEPVVNSTPLHATSYYGHTEIVELLIEYGCDRSQTNSYGLTAFEEAANDEIRQLFERPNDICNGRRFHDETIDDCFDFVRGDKRFTEKSTISVTDSRPKMIRSSSVQGYKTKAEKQREIGYATTSIAMCQSKIGRLLANTFHPNSPMSLESIGKRLQELIDKEITQNQNPHSPKANELLKKFLNDPDKIGRIQYLIRLYTLETNFYRVLKDDPMPLAVPFYIALETLKDRYYQGHCYRGANMSDEDISTYKMAVENRQSFLQTKHFSSSSIKRSVAERFLTGDLKTNSNTRPNLVLFIFNFPEKCDQTINLNRISDKQPCLSEYENEAEILILPWTLFQVDSVEQDSSSIYTICLTNVLLPQKNMLSSLKWVLKHPKGSLERFYQHFPEKQSEML